MERNLYWNSWELIHPFPVVVYRDDEDTALVRYGGRQAILPAHFRPGKIVDRLSITQFAARFPKGRRVWEAHLEFDREPGQTEWSFSEVYLFHGPESASPPQIIGFLADYPARDRGLGGANKKIALRYRARAGLPDGPVNAADFEPSKVCWFAESLWLDETKHPFETAKVVGISFSALLRRFGTPAWIACLASDCDERTGA